MKVRVVFDTLDPEYDDRQEAAAFEKLCELRWPETNGKPKCPRCGGLEPYFLRKRRVFKCRFADCYHQYTPTSGTKFHSRKLPYSTIVTLIFIMMGGKKGKAAAELGRNLDIDMKTAWINCHKVRESFEMDKLGSKLKGDVEIDGVYIGGYVRPANQAKNRRDRRLAVNQSPNRRVVVVARERGGWALVTVVRHEHEAIQWIREVVSPDAVLHLDEASHWDVLDCWFEVRRINHREAYSTPVSNTNQAESHHARMRLMIGGQHHHVSPLYLDRYARHAALLENHRTEHTVHLVRRVVRYTLNSQPSAIWSGRYPKKKA